MGRSSGLRRTALIGLESLATTSIFVFGLKFIVGRARPQTGESSRSFHPFASKSGYYSLPSGHAASIFAVATTIAEQTKGAIVDILAYGLASLAAVSRVHDRKHWPSDVFLGSALGYFTAKKVCSLNSKRKSDRLRVGFQFTSQSRALSLSFSF